MFLLLDQEEYPNPPATNKAMKMKFPGGLGGGG